MVTRPNQPTPTLKGFHNSAVCRTPSAFIDNPPLNPGCAARPGALLLKSFGLSFTQQKSKTLRSKLWVKTKAGKQKRHYTQSGPWARTEGYILLPLYGWRIAGQPRFLNGHINCASVICRANGPSFHVSTCVEHPVSCKCQSMRRCRLK